MKHAGEPICVYAGSAVAEEPAQVMSEIWIQASAHGVGCLTAKDLPAGHQYLRRQTYRWSDGELRLCADGGDT